MKRSQLGWLMGAVLFVLGSPERANACGGTFCDSGPSAMPVDQTGENVLFVMDGQNVEAHVQIQYSGDAERFAWIVPMPKVPEVEVGSQQLFQNLLQGTVPSYGYTTTRDQCDGAGGSGFSLDGGVGTGGSGGSGGSAGSGGGGPTVVFQKVVGAFDVTVLQGGTPAEVSDWLANNGYQAIPSAPAIIEEYLGQDYVFAAIKLTGGAGVDEIHPLVFRYPGTEPCVPLKLTRVAATEDMGVRTFFLGDDRVFPTNYKHVTLNPARIDWRTFGANYTQVVSRAADSAIANGKAFVTEYAGASSVVSTAGLHSVAWNSSAFTSLAATQVIDELNDQSLTYCYDVYNCRMGHPLMLPLLHEYLPPPAGMTDADFYSCLSCNQAQIDTVKWDAAKFAQDLESRIITPGKHARDVLLKYPYLTRMFTTISPAEMTEDPMFHPRADLSNQLVNPNGFGTQRIRCDGSMIMTLPDSREVYLTPQGSWPPFSQAMPWAETIEEVPLSGDPIVLVDNTDVINRELTSWNAQQPGPGGGSGGTIGMGVNGTPIGGSSDSGGCACSVFGGSGNRDAALLALGAGVIALLSRRKRTRRS